MVLGLSRCVVRRRVVVSWNLNGLISCIQNNSFASIAGIGPDILCLQEIRTQQEPVILPGYQHCWNHGQRNGYAGTAVLFKREPLSITFGLCDDGSDEEGRAITMEYQNFFLLNAYVPNSQKNLARHAYRLEWDHRNHRRRAQGPKKRLLRSGNTMD